mmetsp:Transcript_9894/g.20985  ORF Transcript_9894/g.20985 Transcript_9894/m.20985 type:complete len:229 (+) Transcript_9894:403-1089(+)
MTIGAISTKPLEDANGTRCVIDNKRDRRFGSKFTGDMRKLLTLVFAIKNMNGWRVGGGSRSATRRRGRKKLDADFSCSRRARRTLGGRSMGDGGIKANHNVGTSAVTMSRRTSSPAGILIVNFLKDTTSKRVRRASNTNVDSPLSRPFVSGVVSTILESSSTYKNGGREDGGVLLRISRKRLPPRRADHQRNYAIVWGIDAFAIHDTTELGGSINCNRSRPKRSSNAI